MTKKHALKLGNIYSIDWLDHYFADRVRNDGPEPDVVNRTIGILTGITSQYLKLEYCRQVTDESPSTTVSYFKIIRSDVVGLRDFGPFRGAAK